MPFTTKAQDKVEASVGADIVSGYIWRGQDLGGVSLQPSASIAYKGFSLEAWGSVGIEKTNADGYDAKELDLILGYSTGGFSISITDYWFNTGAGYFHYGAHNTAHLYEAQLGYDFGPVAVNWYTNFAGADGVKENGKRAYSSYISVAAPFKLGGLDWTAEVGATLGKRTSTEQAVLPYATSAWELQKTSESPIHSPCHSLPKPLGTHARKGHTS